MANAYNLESRPGAVAVVLELALVEVEVVALPLLVDRVLAPPATADQDPVMPQTVVVNAIAALRAAVLA
jgi:hypothetical protein